MDISKIVLIFGISILIYLAFLFLGFFLKNKNLKAQNLKRRIDYQCLENLLFSRFLYLFEYISWKSNLIQIIIEDI